MPSYQYSNSNYENKLVPYSLIYKMEIPRHVLAFLVVFHCVFQVIFVKEYLSILIKIQPQVSP